MTKPRILIVDDEENLRRVTQLRLEQAGFEVQTAPGGSAALAMLPRFRPE
ncbi:response regulator, partial [bacterium]|nr:response regulator [bacterium]